MYKFKLLQLDVIEPNSKLNPKARSGHRMVADEAGDLYSFGGFNVSVPHDDGELSREPEWQKYKPLFQELWKFNWRTKRWKKLRTKGDIPDKLVSHCMIYWEDKIIIYGGTGLPYGDNSSNKLTVYHIQENYWEVIEPLSEPSRTPVEMYGQACVIDSERGEIYIVGGTNGSQYSLDVHKFNLYTKKWTVLYKSTQVDYEPGCRYRHEIALYNNKLYLFGGSTSHAYYPFDQLPVFDLETHDWSYCKTKPHLKMGQQLYPNARKCHSLTILGNDCYVCGGTDGQKVCSDIWHINMEELKWTLLVEKIPYPVYFHAASVALDGRLTIFGGVDHVNGDSRNNKLTSIWLKVPSLKNICLSAVSYYVQHKVIDPKACKTTGLSEALEVADLLL